MAEAKEKRETIREAVGVVSDADTLQAVIDELLEKGFIWNKISVLANDRTVKKKRGHTYKSVKEAEDDPRAPRMVFLSKETLGQIKGALIGIPFYMAAVIAAGIVIAKGGTPMEAFIATLLFGAAGAAIGALLASFVQRSYVAYLQKQINRGGLLIWVSVHSPEEEKTAQKILNHHQAHDVHVHEMPVEESGFVKKARPR